MELIQKNELKERTYNVLVKELSKNLQLQKESPGKLVATVFYYNDESAAHKIVKEIYIGNFKKTLLKENKYSLQDISEEIPFLKIVCTCNPDDVIDYERLKVHPYYYEFIHVQENYESCNCDESKIISYIINCRQDVEYAAEIMTLICVDVLRINPFLFCATGQDTNSLIPPFITVVADNSNCADMTWNEYKNRIDKMVDYGPIIDNFLRNAKL
jgi:hypothetical protein